MNSRSLQETKQLWKLYHPPIVEPNNNNSNNNNKRSKKSNYYSKLYQEFPTFNDFFKQQMRKDRYTSGEMKMLKSVYEYDISIGRTITTLNKYLEKIERFITENMNSFGLLGHQISVEKAVIWSALQYKKNIIQYEKNSVSFLKYLKIIREHLEEEESKKRRTQRASELKKRRTQRASYGPIRSRSATTK